MTPPTSAGSSRVGLSALDDPAQWTWPPRSATQQRAGLLGRHRPAEQIALPQVAAELAQLIRLRVGLDTLGG
jgi:hypothetical protein